MSQHDYIIANAAGAAVRTDINNVLGAIVTLNAGSTAPTTTYAYMLWADTDSGLLKMRNAANSAWITIGLLAGFKLDDWFAPDDNTDLNVSNSVHGLCPKAPNDLTKFLRGDGGTWATPPTMTPATNFKSYSKTIFGDGSEGNVTITENTTLPDSGIGVRVKQYNNLTIDPGVYLEAHANDKVLVLLVKGTLTLNGTIRMNGRGGLGGATSGVGGGAGAFGGGAGSSIGVTIGMCGGGGGGEGQAGQNGTTGDPYGIPGKGGGTNTSSYPWVPSLPFPSFDGQGGSSNLSANANSGTNIMSAPVTPFPFEIARYLYGAGGGTGGQGTGTAGLGGRGGGVIWIEAETIILGGSNLISVNGVNGTAGVGVGGGGGGGAGGFAQVVYKSKTGSFIFQKTGGTGAIGYLSYYGGNGADGLSGEFQVE